jgi:uncharacterized membrane protein YdjX (TVP38/TMEM64 family)
MTRAQRQSEIVRPGLADGLAAADPYACPMASDAPVPRRGLVRMIPLALFVALIAIAYWRGWFGALNLETLVAVHTRFHAFIHDHPVATLAAYTLAYVAVGALCVPGSALLTAAGGLVFGTLVATGATLIGATIGATLIFLIARTALSDWLAERQAAWFQKLRAGFEQDAFNYLLFLRLVPAFPFWFVNIAAAVLGLPLRTFVLGTFIGILPASLAFTSAGAGLGSVIAAAKENYAQCLAAGGGASCKLTISHQALFTKELALSLLLLGCLSLFPIAIKRWRQWRRAHV